LFSCRKLGQGHPEKYPEIDDMTQPAAGKSKLTLDIETALLVALKARAKAEGLSYTAYLERLIREDYRAPEGPSWHEYQAAYFSALSVSFLTELVTNQYGEEVTDEILQSAAEHMEQTFGPSPRPPKSVRRPLPGNQETAS